MRIDERRRERQARRRRSRGARSCRGLADLGDHAVVDAHVEHRVDPLDGIEHARAADHEVVRARAPGEHHATPTAVSTATGPVVSRS